MNKLHKKTGNLIGVISDTHNLLRPEAVAALTGVELILHAGDICKPQILEELSSIAPVVAVRGNNDKGGWAKDIPVFEVVEVGAVSIFIIHDIKEMSISSAITGFKLVISGHSHKPFVEERNGILYLNPGSAGPKRFKLPVSLARLRIDGENLDIETVKLEV